MSTHHTITLSGCTPTPLASYLKALGIFRVISLQYPEGKARACWNRNAFSLTSSLDADALLEFFATRYEPTPLVAPWNGGSGFFPKDNTKALKEIEASKAPRLTTYRETISAAFSALQSLKIAEKPDNAEKQQLLLRCRNTFSETALEWLDSAFVLTEGGAKYPPLLGTGGNDGRLEFTNNFMQRLTEVFEMDAEGTPATEKALLLLGAALFDTPTPGLANKPFGQFSPAAGGGANGGTGFDAQGAVNPWDFILALEGALIFATATLKRIEGLGRGQLAYPFCVNASGAGYGSSSAADETAARCEIWMPLWDTPVGLSELQHLLTEGRAWVGRRPPKDGIDFARAVTSLGVDRGIAEFQRYGFHVRNGLAYFATPLQRLRVRRDTVSTDLLAPCDGWLERFLPAAKAATAPGSIQRAARRLESAILSQCASAQTENRGTALELLLSLSSCEEALGTSLKWTHEARLKPLPPLSSVWIEATECDRPEFRLAAALASIQLLVEKRHFPIRRHLEPVEVAPGSPGWAQWQDEGSREVVSTSMSAPQVLIAIMRRRLLLAQSHHPQSWPEYAGLTAHPSDLADFIDGKHFDDRLFLDLLRALCLVGCFATTPLKLRTRPKNERIPSAFFAQLKLCFTGFLPEEHCVPVNANVFNLASGGDGARASLATLRRLHGSSIPVLHTPIEISGDTVVRSAAALLFPLWRRQLEAVAKPIAPQLFREKSTNLSLINQ